MANEKRLIDANRALEIVREQGHEHPNAYHLTNYATLILQEAPTVDAVEVVRCKDCKHWEQTGGLLTYWECNIFSGIHGNGYPTNADDFCSYGERREGE